MDILLITADMGNSVKLSGELELLGHQVHCVASGPAAVDWLESRKVELIVASWEMSAAMAFELLKWVRLRHGTSLNILFWTGSAVDAELVMTFNRDLHSPLSRSSKLLELAARLNIANCPITGSEIAKDRFSVGGYLIDNQKRKVSLLGETVILTTMEFDLASLMFSNIGRPVSRKFISSLVWGRKESGETRSLDTHMSRIRAKLFLTGKYGLTLSAVYARGYRLDRRGHASGNTLHEEASPHDEAASSRLPETEN